MSRPRKEPLRCPRLPRNAQQTDPKNTQSKHHYSSKTLEKQPSSHTRKFPRKIQKGADRKNGAHGVLHKVQSRDGRPGRTPLRLRLRPEDLQKRQQKGLGRVGRAPEDAFE